MKCQILFSGKNKKSITNLQSAELAQRVVPVKVLLPLHVFVNLYCLHHLDNHLSYWYVDFMDNSDNKLSKNVGFVWIIAFTLNIRILKALSYFF